MQKKSLKDLKLDVKQKGDQKNSRGQRKNIALKASAEDNTIYQNFKKIDKKNNKDDVAFIIRCLNKHFIFYSLMEDVHAIQYLIDHLFYCQVKGGQLIIKQGSNASSFFILHTGKIQISINGVVKKQLKPGDGLGQLALLYNSQRSASCKAIENCTLWCIDRHTFRKIVQQINTKLYNQNRKFLNQVKFFDNLTSSQKDDITGILIKQRFIKNQVIVNQGDPANSFYIIKSGEVKITSKGKQFGKLKQGQYFGQNGIMGQNQVRGMTIVSQKQTILLSLGRQSLKSVLGSNLQLIIFRNKIRNILTKSPYFSKLSKIHHQKIIDSLAVRKVEQKQLLCKPGQLCRQKMFFVLDGQILKNGEKVDHRSLFFGQQSLDSSKAGLKYDITVQVSKAGNVAQINFKQLNQIVGGSFQQAVMKIIKTGQIQASKINAAQSRRDKMSQVPISDLLALKKLGFGQFGSVYLVVSKSTKQIFALKCISKHQIIQSKLQKHLQQQKKVLQLVNFPFIMQYVRSYKDQYQIYFLMEFIRGMQLFDVIRQIGLLHKSDSQFYIGSIILALQYLHSNSIIYRDLKPQNIMIDDTGYLKLIDMGTCKFLKGKGPKTFTIIGTPHYMAPQVLGGKGYGLNVDLWSIGVCLYQFMVGYVPYGQQAQDPYQIYQQVIKKTLTFPSYVTDKQAKMFIQQLLNKTPQARLGGSYAALKTHTWFKNFDWDDLVGHKLKAPFIIPDTKMIKLLSVDNLIKNGKPIIQEIKSQGSLKKAGTRKDLDPNWDKIY